MATSNRVNGFFLCFRKSKSFTSCSLCNRKCVENNYIPVHNGPTKEQIVHNPNIYARESKRESRRFGETVGGPVQCGPLVIGAISRQSDSLSKRNFETLRDNFVFGQFFKPTKEIIINEWTLDMAWHGIVRSKSQFSQTVIYIFN